jgi:NAD(P)-dependent dehydrogenase (short-subunit alcohol dehydrogenase family)
MEDMFGLAGKTAIVWGGGQGMGETSALRLARAGCDIAVVDQVGERAGAVTARIQALGRKAVAITADITSEAEVARTMTEAESALAPIDVMVSVIGMAGWVKLVDMSSEEWDRIVTLNLKGFFLAAQAAARSMIAGGRKGSIVSVASVSGLTAAPMHGHYGAAKAGLVNLVRSMASEWSPQIRINAIAPGTIETARVEATEQRVEAHRKRVPMQRMGQPDEIAKAVLFMASDLASYVTGQTLAVDGGWMSTFLLDWRSEMSTPHSTNVAYKSS